MCHHALLSVGLFCCAPKCRRYPYLTLQLMKGYGVTVIECYTRARPSWGVDEAECLMSWVRTLGLTRFSTLQHLLSCLGQGLLQAPPLVSGLLEVSPPAPSSTEAFLCTAANRGYPDSPMRTRLCQKRFRKTSQKKKNHTVPHFVFQS